MISKTDCLLLLNDINTAESKAVAQKVVIEGITLDTLKFINDNRELSLSSFYEKLRKSYNAKKSKLFGNIVKEKNDLKTILTTLAALQLQIVLYMDNVDDKQMFLRHARFIEINKCLSIYAETNNVLPCSKLLSLIKADIEAFQQMKIEK